MCSMRCLLFAIVVLFAASVMAREGDNTSDNKVDDAEGRACGSCGGIKPPIVPSITTKPIDPLVPILISALGSLPVLAFHILGIIVLALLLKSLLSDKNEGAASDGYYYSGQSYADPFASAGPAGYNKRSFSSYSPWSLQDIQNSPVVNFLTQIVSDAIDKYNVIEEKEGGKTKKTWKE